MGFTNFVPCVNSLVCISDFPTADMVLGLLSLRMAITPDRRRALADNTLLVKDTKISYRGTPAWRKMPCVLTKVGTLSNAWAYAPNLLLSNQIPHTYMLYCPACSSGKEVKHITLYKKGIWKSLCCLRCRNVNTCRGWQCPCGLPWFSCSLHANLGFSCRARTRKAPIPRRPFVFYNPAVGDTSLLPIPQPRRHNAPSLSTAACVQRVHTAGPSNTGLHPSRKRNMQPTLGPQPPKRRKIGRSSASTLPVKERDTSLALAAVARLKDSRSCSRSSGQNDSLDRHAKLLRLCASARDAPIAADTPDIRTYPYTHRSGRPPDAADTNHGGLVKPSEKGPQ